ncbi:MAG: alpha-glucosidase [Solirubrobacteraceae bacterium]|jgi:alpha-glucosidase|nr:alpha-glucosidase [Solirubrobacteraceae bacterium]
MRRCRRRRAAQHTPAADRLASSWWQDGVLYQIYPRSFADSDGDGHGDLQGVRARLPHLSRLGVSGVWLNPTSPSPNADWGYDVSDYCDVHPDFGTLADMDALLADAHDAGIRVLLDLVPNHTSDRHPWFAESRSSRDNPKADWYVWADPAPGGGPPNNWVSMFGGPAWEYEPRRGQFYLRNFTANQPDLNWWCDEVRDEFDRILRFWLDRGVDGFRIDVCQAIVKDRDLRDNPPATPADRANVRLRGQRPVYSMNRPEVHDVLRRWRALCETYPHKPILLGETNTHDLEGLSRYYGETAGDELHMAFNFPFMSQEFAPGPIRAIVEQTERTLPRHAQPVWTTSNHDAARFASRWCGDDPRKVRVALMLLLSLRGTPLLYYGDELGLPDVPVAREVARDPLAAGTLPGKDGRDPCRTPMPWDASEHFGFGTADPWLPAGDRAGRTVADQDADPGSTLQLTRRLIALRAGEPDLRRAPVRFCDAADGLLVFDRGDVRVILNFSERAHPLGDGEPLVATGPTPGGLLGPWQGVVVRRARGRTSRCG